MVLPALALLVLAVFLVRSGGFGGVLAGLVVAGLALGILAVAVLMTHAPVTIHNILTRSKEDKLPAEPETPQDRSSNGHR